MQVDFTGSAEDRLSLTKSPEFDITNCAKKCMPVNIVRKTVHVTIRFRKEAKRMNSATVVGLLALAVILFFAIRYIYKEKKKGNACIGCPYAGSCSKHSCSGQTGYINPSDK